jgi:hypothetical protein
MDFKKILSHTDTFLQLAGVARDKIVERIDKEMEKKLEDAVHQRGIIEDEMVRLQLALSDTRKELEDERRWRKEAEAALDKMQTRAQSDR